MSLTNFPYGLASYGMPLLGSGPVIPPTTGKVFFVDGVTGIDANGRGEGPEKPFDTIAYAISKCRNAKGDIIICLPGHTETVSTATAFNINKSGVTIVGLGNGNQRATITLNTLVGATLTISAAEVTFDNIVVDMTGFDNITVGVTVTGAGCRFRNCRFITNTASVSVATAFSIGAARFELYNCIVDGTGADTGTVAIISSSAAIDLLRVLYCDIRANCSTAIFSSSGSNHITNLTIGWSVVRQSNGTAKNVFNLTTSSTGEILYNIFNGTTWSTAADVASNSTSVNLRWFQNFGFDDGAGAVSGVLVPAAGTIA